MFFAISYVLHSKNVVPIRISYYSLPGTTKRVNSQSRSLSLYQNLPNYRNNWFRMGSTEDDVDNLTDRFIDTTFAWGDVDTITNRIQEHLDAGASHVCIQPVNPNTQFRDPHWEALEALAP